MNRSPVRGAARLAAILDALPDALLLVDGSSTVVNANAAALELFEGESAQRLLGKPLISVLPSFGRSVATFGNAPAALTAGSSPAGSAQNGSDGERAEAYPTVRGRPQRQAAARTDGSVFPAEVSSAAVPGEDGDVVLLIIRDLTGVLDVEAELRRQQRQIELILRAASEGIVGVDHEGRIVLVNPAGAKILRYRASDLGAQNVHELIAHSTADGTPTTPEQCSLIDSLRSGTKHHSADEVLWRSDGTAVYVDMTTAPVYEGENIIGAVMTFTDNSAAQAAARQSRELAQLLEQQLQAPLGAALMQLRETTEYGIGEIGPGVRQSLMAVAAELAQANAVVEDLVDYQRLVIGDTRYVPQRVSLPDVIDAAVTTASELAESMGVDIVAHTPDIEVSLDPVMFGKLLTHLLADMVNATPVGGKILLATTRRESVLRIELRGPHTGGNATHLSIARAIASRHGGTVTTHRIAGKGNTHVIEVPWEIGKQGAGAAVVGAAAGTVRTTRPAVLPAPAKVEAPAAVPVPDERETTWTPERPQARPVERAAERPVERAVDLPVDQPVARANGRAYDRVDDRVNDRSADLPVEQQVPVANGRTVDNRISASGTTGSSSAGLSAPIRTVTVNGRTSVPAQSRSAMARSLGIDPADLKPSRPLPTSDVWARPERADQDGSSGDGNDPSPRGRRRFPAQEEPEEPSLSHSALNYAAQRGPMDGLSDDPLESSVAEQVSVQLSAPSLPAPRLLVWPEPDPSTTDLLNEHGYVSTALSSHEDVPAALNPGNGVPRPSAVFVDPIAAPITRRGLRALQGAAAAAGLPILVTAGIGAAPHGSAPGPDPALLLQALTPAAAALPRVMLVEQRPDLAIALTRSLERQGMQVLHAPTDSESVAAAVRGAPDVVIMDLMQIRRRRVGIIEWLRDQRRLALTPIVVYTAADIDQDTVSSLNSGAWSLYLAERAVDTVAGTRVADLLSKIVTGQ